MASITTAGFQPDRTASPPGTAGAVPRAAARLVSIDALRGFVMVLMLLDHIREAFLLWVPIGDPVDALTVDPSSFFSRLTSTVCAPVFVALTGLGAYLYGQKHSRAETSAFLFKRGALLVLLELTVVNFVWRAEFPPTILYLQVIWAIGLSMIVLSALIRLPHAAILAIGVAIVAGHNLLSPIDIPEGAPFHTLWAFLHDRGTVSFGGFPVRFSYPLLPWIGVICLGWAIGPWFAGGDPAARQRRLLQAGAAMLIGFVVLRAINVYGDTPWFVVPGSPIRTVMSFLALTKYPPSLLFVLATLGVGLLLLAWFDRVQDSRAIGWLAIFGGAPMFFYLFHLYVLRVMYLAAVAIWGINHDTVFGFPSIQWIWLMWIAMIVPLYFPTRWFSNLKKRRKDIGWLKYF
ncbi:heparan-alpha-glucosaminide N-acetyltransferase domain-containing protein [uncultured Sphingomonas sp.]|uniref:DUF1624 domain-containing protein n=1 Tax=uncultured Sphingomonas sp. TaxID=158754 RepID=UPI002582C692|nr:heparan-alpha-glucosaminide N-acetyltransferase domain-containing protein [uncultured Sphingomonas sp.]